MKRTILFLLTIVLILALLVGWTFVPAKIPAGDPPSFDSTTSPPSVDVTVRVLHTGTMEALAALSYRGGDFSDKRAFVMPALLIQHPEGNLLVDAGLGVNALEHLAGEPWLMRALSEAHPTTPAVRQLNDTPIDGIILTHAHWDHVSGVDDFAGVPVYMPNAEREFVASGHEASRLARQLFAKHDTTLVPLEFHDGPFMSFDSSHDFFGDGSLVIVPAPGHTPGSIWIFVSSSSSDRYLLVGDTVWQHEGFEIPAEKPWIARRRVDFDAEATRDCIRTLHHIANAGGWHILPAHDEKSWAMLTE